MQFTFMFFHQGVIATGSLAYLWHVSGISLAYLWHIWQVFLSFRDLISVGHLAAALPFLPLRRADSCGFAELTRAPAV